MKVYKARRKSRKLKRMLKKFGSFVGGAFALMGMGIALRAAYVAGMARMADKFTGYAENEFATNTAIGVMFVIVGMLIMWCVSENKKEN